ncbi:universal stress protein [Chitinophaga ginsengisoli]|uniref:Nucleotide-binding universal stress UspA family protein n=1 Tax=Chitinophaga ginsengisoli TaxID=363837 RepID=A0A2P8GL33_9BACT|nr:universal stress protein [Chitinophaga ginsengisoli]PSL34666.1 nucleotide-binding universal stress UspA family protein [Chitinophaga ginsengisoli]
MKKIIAVFDGLKFSESTLSYTITLGEQSKSHIVGVFLNNIAYYSRNPYRILAEADNNAITLEELQEEDAATRAKAVERFSAACSEAGLNYSVHKNKDTALLELLHESTYADLVIIDASETFNRYTEDLPTRFIRDFLAEVQCPVLLAPKFYVPIRKSILLYDGQPSSVYAIKMFSYLLPVLNALSAEVITVKESDDDLHLPDNRLMKEFMKRHQPNAVYTVLKGDPEEEILSRLRSEDGKSIIVVGAYRRGVVSRFFRNSMADVLMREIKWPLFIAHQ